MTIQRPCKPNALPGYTVPLVLEACILNVKTNVQQSDTRAASTLEPWVLHQAAPAQLAGLDVTAGVMLLTWEMLI